jgi:PAS domain S-box-containing protein
MVGANRDELIGRDVSAVLPEASPDLPHDVQADAEAPTKAESAHENETIPVEIEDREVTVGGETVHVRAVRDISKRKEWENEILLAKQEAEQQDVSL